MSSSCSLRIAGPSLLEIARRADPMREEGCQALLELVNAADRLRSELRHELSKARLSHTGFNILALVHNGGPEPLGTGGIAERLELSAQTVSAALARLELAGFVTLTRQPTNRRRITVELTIAGEAIIRSALDRIEDVVHRLMSTLSPSDLRQLQASSSRLALAPQAQLV